MNYVTCNNEDTLTNEQNVFLTKNNGFGLTNFYYVESLAIWDFVIKFKTKILLAPLNFDDFNML